MVLDAERGARVALGVEVDDEHGAAGLRQGRGDVDRRRRLADPALLVGDGEHPGARRARDGPTAQRDAPAGVLGDRQGERGVLVGTGHRGRDLGAHARCRRAGSGWHPCRPLGRAVVLVPLSTRPPTATSSSCGSPDRPRPRRARPPPCHERRWSFHVKRCPVPAIRGGWLLARASRGNPSPGAAVRSSATSIVVLTRPPSCSGPGRANHNPTTPDTPKRHPHVEPNTQTTFPAAISSPVRFTEQPRPTRRELLPLPTPRPFHLKHCRRPRIRVACRPFTCAAARHLPGPRCGCAAAGRVVHEPCRPEPAARWCRHRATRDPTFTGRASALSPSPPASRWAVACPASRPRSPPGAKARRWRSLSSALDVAIRAADLGNRDVPRAGRRCFT